MRSELVFAAKHTVGNRYTLCHAAAKGTRKFLTSRHRIQDTMNEVLQRLAESDREPVARDSEHDLADRRRSALSAHWTSQVQKLVG